jgi:hypothetical protein
MEKEKGAGGGRGQRRDKVQTRATRQTRLARCYPTHACRPMSGARGWILDSPSTSIVYDGHCVTLPAPPMSAHACPFQRPIIHVRQTAKCKNPS